MPWSSFNRLPRADPVITLIALQAGIEVLENHKISGRLRRAHLLFCDDGPVDLLDMIEPPAPAQAEIIPVGKPVGNEIGLGQAVYGMAYLNKKKQTDSKNVK